MPYSNLGNSYNVTYDNKENILGDNNPCPSGSTDYCCLSGRTSGCDAGDDIACSGCSGTDNCGIPGCWQWDGNKCIQNVFKVCSNSTVCKTNYNKVCMGGCNGPPGDGCPEKSEYYTCPAGSYESQQNCKDNNKSCSSKPYGWLCECNDDSDCGDGLNCESISGTTSKACSCKTNAVPAGSSGQGGATKGCTGIDGKCCQISGWGETCDHSSDYYSSGCAPGLKCNSGNKCECEMGSHQGSSPSSSSRGCKPAISESSVDHGCCQSNWGEGCHEDTNRQISGAPEGSWAGYQWCGPGLSCVTDHNGYKECECEQGTHDSSQGACNTKGNTTDKKNCCCGISCFTSHAGQRTCTCNV